MLKIIKPDNLYLLGECPINLRDLRKNIRRFYIFLRYDDFFQPEKNTTRIILSKSYLDISLSLLNNLLKKDTNQLILNDVEKNQEENLDECLGRIQKKLEEYLDTSLTETSLVDLKTKRVYNLLSLMNHLMMSLVVIPLIKGLENYQKESEIGEEQFLFKVYLEFKTIVKALGPKTIQEMKYVQTQHPPPRRKTKREIEPDEDEGEKEKEELPYGDLVENEN